MGYIILCGYFSRFTLGFAVLCYAVVMHLFLSMFPFFIPHLDYADHRLSYEPFSCKFIIISLEAWRLALSLCLFALLFSFFVSFFLCRSNGGCQYHMISTSEPSSPLKRVRRERLGLRVGKRQAKGANIDSLICMVHYYGTTFQLGDLYEVTISGNCNLPCRCV